MSAPEDREETHEEKMARRAVQFGHLRKFKRGEVDEDAEYAQLWLKQSVAMRITAMETLRKLHWGDEYDVKQGIPRPVEIVQRSGR